MLWRTISESYVIYRILHRVNDNDMEHSKLKRTVENQEFYKKVF